MSELGDIFYKACLSLDTSKISEALEEGADINETDKFGESVLSKILLNPFSNSDPKRYEVISFLLDKGADPNLLDEERCSPLTYAMFQMDAEMTELLCSYGARPNDVAGFSEKETLYDWARVEYEYEYADFNFPHNPSGENKNVYPMAFPEEPTKKDQKDERSWLDFMQRMAEKYNFKEPKHLFVLRKYGARSCRELHDGNL